MVSMTPVVHLVLWISPPIFGKIWKGPNGGLRGLGETNSWKKLEAENLVTLSLQIVLASSYCVAIQDRPMVVEGGDHIPGVPRHVDHLRLLLHHLHNRLSFKLCCFKSSITCMRNTNFKNFFYLFWKQFHWQMSFYQPKQCGMVSKNLFKKQSW